MEDEAIVLFEEVVIVKYVIKLPSEASQMSLCGWSKPRQGVSRTQSKIRIRVRDSQTYRYLVRLVCDERCKKGVTLRHWTFAIADIRRVNRYRGNQEAVELPISHEDSFLDPSRDAASDQPAGHERNHKQPWNQNSDKGELRQVVFDPSDNRPHGILQPPHFKTLFASVIGGCILIRTIFIF